MKKVTLYGGQSFFIDDSKYEALKEHINSGTIVEITSVNGEQYLVNPTSVSKITPAGAEAPRLDDKKQIAAPVQDFNPDGEGYKKYLAMRDKLIKRMGKK